MTIEPNGTGIGMTRSMVFTNGFRLVERLEALDNASMVLKYSVVDNPALTYTNYRAVFTVKPDAADRSILSWSVTFTPRTGQEETSRKTLLLFVNTYFNNLTRIVSSKP